MTSIRLETFLKELKELPSDSILTTDESFFLQKGEFELHSPEYIGGKKYSILSIGYQDGSFDENL